jgi:hypothetical protein
MHQDTRLRRWALRPLLELAYVVLGMFVGIVTFTVTVVGLSLGVGLLPLFLIGVPMLIATVYVVHGFAIMERRRARLFLRADLPPRPLRRWPGRSLWSKFVGRLSSPEFWKEVTYSVLLLPFGLISGSLVVSFYAPVLCSCWWPAC